MWRSSKEEEFLIYSHSSITLNSDSDVIMGQLSIKENAKG